MLHLNLNFSKLHPEYLGENLVQNYEVGKDYSEWSHPMIEFSIYPMRTKTRYPNFISDLSRNKLRNLAFNQAEQIKGRNTKLQFEVGRYF